MVLKDKEHKKLPEVSRQLRICSRKFFQIVVSQKKSIIDNDRNVFKTKA